jgi:hypothetical protein
MKKILLLSLFLFPAFLFAQDTLRRHPADSLRHHIPDSLRQWHRGGLVALNFAQASFTNWAAGGDNSISGQARFNGYINYKKDSTVFWENGLELGYGLAQIGRGYLRKTDDKIDFTSKYGRYAFKQVWYYSALLGFKTQFLPGYDYKDDTAKTLISDFMSPAYTILAIGLDYKPNKNFSVFIAPLTGKMTIVKNQALADSGAFGVDKALLDTAGNVIKHGQNVRYEFGGYVRISYKKEIMKNVFLTTRCELFTNYLEDPQNIDVNAEVLLTMKVNKYISASLNMQGIYDNDINIAIDKNNDGITDANGPRFQFRQVLGVGFSAKF